MINKYALEMWFSKYIEKKMYISLRKEGTPEAYL